MDEDPFVEGLLPPEGEILSRPVYEDTKAVPGAFIVRRKGGGVEIIDLAGETILAGDIKNIVRRGDRHLQLYAQDRKQRVYDLPARAFLGEVYDEVEFIEEPPLVIVETGENHRFLTHDMTPAFDGVYDHVRYLGEGRFMVSLPDGDALIDQTGAEIIPPNFARLWPHPKHRLIVASTGRLSVYFNYEGDRITRRGLRAHYAPSREKRHITVSDEKRRWGVVDKTGAVVIEPKYARVHQFSEGYLPAARRAGDAADAPLLFGLVDENDVEALPFANDNLHLVENGRLWAKKSGKWGLIDLEEREIAPFVFEAISRPRDVSRHDNGENDRVMIAKRNGRFGVIRREDGEILLPFAFDGADLLGFRLIRDGENLSYPWDFREN